MKWRRSPAFRTGPKSLDLTEKRKPKATDTPCKLGSNKSEICKLEICKSDCWRIEEALKAPLPTGPAPKKPPRTFLHNSCSNQLDSAGTSAAGSTGSSLNSPQRPARKKSNRFPEKPSVNIDFIESLSKKTKTKTKTKTNKNKIIDDLSRFWDYRTHEIAMDYVGILSGLLVMVIKSDHGVRRRWWMGRSLWPGLKLNRRSLDEAAVAAEAVEVAEAAEAETIRWMRQCGKVQRGGWIRFSGTASRRQYTVRRIGTCQNPCGT